MPDSTRIVACNTTPLIALLLLGRLDLLRDLYGKVIIPPTVRDEFLAGPPQIVRAEALRRSPWIQTVNLRVPQNVNFLADLDRGEAEAITLAQEQGADLVIIDEKMGRRYARRLGLTSTGTIGVLLRAKQQGLVQSLKPLIETLRAGGFYLADALVEEALRLAGE
jgi:predicted nucleic acid-binding protein